jgi:hypothetical protein
MGPCTLMFWCAAQKLCVVCACAHQGKALLPVPKLTTWIAWLSQVVATGSAACMLLRNCCTAGQVRLRALAVRGTTTDRPLPCATCHADLPSSSPSLHVVLRACWLPFAVACSHNKGRAHGLCQACGELTVPGPLAPPLEDSDAPRRPPPEPCSLFWLRGTAGAGAADAPAARAPSRNGATAGAPAGGAAGSGPRESGRAGGPAGGAAAGAGGARAALAAVCAAEVPPEHAVAVAAALLGAVAARHAVVLATLPVRGRPPIAAGAISLGGQRSVLCEAQG